MTEITMIMKTETKSEIPQSALDAARNMIRADVRAAAQRRADAKAMSDRIKDMHAYAAAQVEWLDKQTDELIHQFHGLSGVDGRVPHRLPTCCDAGDMVREIAELITSDECADTSDAILVLDGLIAQARQILARMR